MKALPAFHLHRDGAVGAAAFRLGITNFGELTDYVRALPYGRVSLLDAPQAVLETGRGTCSSKHRLLAAAAVEADRHDIELIVGIYLMRARNTPGIGLALGEFDEIPEAHCYLRASDVRYDFTGLPPGPESPFDALVSEFVTTPDEVGRAKAETHRDALARWAAGRGVSFDEAWGIREACIAALVRAGGGR